MIVFNTSNITFICFSFLHFAFISHLSRSIFRYIPCYFYPFFNIQILIVIGTYITLHLTSISLYLHAGTPRLPLLFGNTFPKGVFIILSSSFFFLHSKNKYSLNRFIDSPIVWQHLSQRCIHRFPYCLATPFPKVYS